jgi:AcrR family transcriptional regulator
LATRRRMVEAAYRLFCANGYLGTTMSAIAAEAGVAVQTLYYTFHTKAAVLDEVIGAAIVGFDNWRQPPPDPQVGDLLTWHPWWVALEAAPDAGAALEVFVTNGVRVLERVGPIVAAMHGGTGDPEAQAVVRTAEDRRVDAYRVVVQALAHKPGGLRPGLSEAAATDILVVVFSAEVFQALARRGWSLDRCTSLFQTLLGSQLLAPAADRAGE